MNETEIKKQIDLIYDAEAALGTPLKDAFGKIQLSQMRLYSALYRSNDEEKAKSREQIKAAAIALHSAKQLIDEIATRITSLEVSMVILKRRAIELQ